MSTDNFKVFTWCGFSFSPNRSPAGRSSTMPIS